MKKLLYILGFIMFFSAVMQPIVALGEDSEFSKLEKDTPYSTARIFSKLVESVGLDPNADWTTSFGVDDEKDVGKDMYLIIYKKILNEPVQRTSRNIAGKYGLNEGDLWRTMHGDYSTLLERKPGLTQYELQNKVLEIQSEYKEMRDIEELRANIKAAVEPAEMFANGNLRDSGFDLVNDLEIIEELLFLETTVSDVGGSYSGSTDKGSPSVGGIGKVEQPLTDDKKVPVPAIEFPPQPVSDKSKNGLKKDSDGAGDTVASINNDDSKQEEFNPNTCFSDNEFDDALNKFNKKSQTDVNYKNLSSGQLVKKGSGIGTFPSLPTSFGDITPKAGDSFIPDIEDDFFPTIKAPDANPVKAAPADNWLEEPACDGVFCMEINFVKAPAVSSFSNADNCIACHVEKINDIMKDFVSHSLVPTKAPGNLFEGAECKNAMLTVSTEGLNMNIYTEFLPVKTPPNDDIMYGTNFEDEWASFCNQVAFFPTEACQSVEEKKKHVYEIQPVLIDRATKSVITTSPEEITQLEASTRINEIVTGYETEQAEAIKKYETSEAVANKAAYFQPIFYELDQMNFMFSSISGILQSLHEAETGACYLLKNKNECT